MSAPLVPDAGPVMRAVARLFAIQASTAVSLGSHEDLNVLMTDAAGEAWVAKLAHPSASRDATLAQLAALEHLAAQGLTVPSVRRAVSGALVDAVEIDGEPRLLWVLGFVPGRIMTSDATVPPGFAAHLGACAAGLVGALRTFEHPGLLDGGPWDLRQAPAVVASAAQHLEAAERERVNAAITWAWEAVEPVAPSLPVQAIHGDLTGDNVVLDGAGSIAGIIDFGDLARGWRIAELAVAMASLLHHEGDSFALAIDAAAAFADAARAAGEPLSDAELAALWPLVVARTCVLVSSAAIVAAQEPGNDYARSRRPLERRMFERAVGIDPSEAELLIRHAVGAVPTSDPVPAVPTSVPVPVSLTAMVDASRAAVVSLAVTSAVHDAGAFAAQDAARSALQVAAAAAGAAVAPYGEHRLTADALGPSLPRSLALGVEACLPGGTQLLAPADATVASSTEDHVILDLGHGAGTIVVAGALSLVSEGDAVAAGHPVARVRGGDIGIVWLQRCAATGIVPPRFATPGAEAAWREICPDPSALLGIAPAQASEPDAGGLLESRREHVAAVQEYYYDAPPRIERGWRHHLIDAHGRGYLDMINNVAILGHGEPRIADAVSRQLRLLNTNSRFHYGAIADFAQRLAAKAPAGLDAVLLVNSGSEAVDLALRIVRAVTGRPDVLALTEAYHGWTVGADAISTSLGDNPQALGTRPEWVHLLDAPNTYRGKHRGTAAGGYLDDALARLDDLDARGVALAGVVAEPIFGNGGGVLLPDGYLAGLWEAVRSRGGLAVSDEVQVSYGRLGKHFWGFEQQGVVPDVIAVAKAMGNGHPLGAVITTREIADAFGAEGSFFSSAGGSPVSCVVGSTVLDVLEGDSLQANAESVGTMLRDALVDLGRSHPALGAVHGMGLYLGVEVVDGGPEHPDPTAAHQICEALLHEGVIVQPTGDHKNVLKIKPPLTIDADAVARFVKALDKVMTLREARAAL